MFVWMCLFARQADRRLGWLWLRMKQEVKYWNWDLAVFPSWPVTSFTSKAGAAFCENGKSGSKLPEHRNSITTGFMLFARSLRRCASARDFTLFNWITLTIWAHLPWN